MGTSRRGFFGRVAGVIAGAVAAKALPDVAVAEEVIEPWKPVAQPGPPEHYYISTCLVGELPWGSLDVAINDGRMTVMQTRGTYPEISVPKPKGKPKGKK